MNITIPEKNCVVITTPQGTFQVLQTETETGVYWHDHAEIIFRGKPHNAPLIAIDSEEYATRMHIYQSESKWKELWHQFEAASENGGRGMLELSESQNEKEDHDCCVTMGMFTGADCKCQCHEDAKSKNEGEK